MFTLLIEKRFRYQTYCRSCPDISCYCDDDRLLTDRDMSFSVLYNEIIGKEVVMTIDNNGDKDLKRFDTCYDIYSSGILDYDKPEFSIYVIGRIVPAIYEPFTIETNYVLGSSKEEAVDAVKTLYHKRRIYEISDLNIAAIGRYYQL